MVSELSDMISLPAAAEVKASLQSWAEGGMLATVAVANMAVAGIQQRLLEAAGPEGYEASETSTLEAGAECCDDAASTPALALPAPSAAAVAPKQAKRRKPLLLRLLFAGVFAAGAAAAAVEARKQLELRTAKPKPAPAEPVAAPAASA
jgi:hypothetical protein